MCLHMRKRVSMLASHRGRSIAAAVRREDAAFAELRARDNEVLEESKVTHPPGVRVYPQAEYTEGVPSVPLGTHSRMENASASA